MNGATVLAASWPRNGMHCLIPKGARYRKRCIFRHLDGLSAITATREAVALPEPRQIYLRPTFP